MLEAVGAVVAMQAFYNLLARIRHDTPDFEEG
jgi:hypothetical protein